MDYRHQITLIPDSVIDEATGQQRSLKDELLEVIPRVLEAARTMNLNNYRIDLKFLFDVYNTFIAGHRKEKVTCNNCRLKVVAFFTAYEQTKKADS